MTTRTDGVSPQGFYGHRRPQIRASNANVHHISDCTSSMQFMHLIDKSKHVLADPQHTLHDVLTIDKKSISFLGAQGHVQYSAIFRCVEFYPSEQIINGTLNIRLLGQALKGFKNLIIPSLLGHVDVHSVEFSRKFGQALRIVLKFIPYVQGALVLDQAHNFSLRLRIRQPERSPRRMF